MSRMPENEPAKNLLQDAAEEYAFLLEDTMREMGKEANAFEVEVPDKITKRLSRKYKLHIGNPGPFQMFAAGIALALFIIVFTVSWFPHTTIAIVNAFRELVFVSDSRSMEVQSKEKSEPDFSIEVPEGFLSEGTYAVCKNITRTRFESSSDYIEITKYYDEYTMIYDNENDSDAREITINAYHGRIFRKNNIITIVLDDYGDILEFESSLPEDALIKIVESYERKEQ